MPVAVRRSHRGKYPRSAAVLPLAAVLLAVSFAPVPAQLFDSSNMVLLSRQDLFDGYNDVWGFVGNDGREYIIQGTITGTAWWDVQDPFFPVMVDFISGPASTWRDMFVIGDYCYVGTEGGGGLQIIDISNPTDPVLVATYSATVSSCHNIFGDVARQLIYVVGASGGGGLKVLDASNPTSLVEIGSWNTEYFHDVSTYGDYAYGCAIYQGRMRVIDVSNPSNPVAVGPGFPSASSHASWPLGDGVHVALAAERMGGHLEIVDVSDPFAISLVDEDNPAPTASIHNVHVEGTRIYCAWYKRGMRLYDAANPTAITEIGYLDTFPPLSGGLFSGNWGVYPHLPSGLIAVNDRTYGLFLMRYEPDAAVLSGTITSSEGGGPVDGVDLTLSGTTQSMMTETDGAYRMTAYPGSHDILASKYGFEDALVNVNAVAAGSTVTDFVLTKYPHGTLSGVVTDAQSGGPLDTVTLEIAGTPLTALTDSAGAYTFPEVPTLPSASYQVDVVRPGYGLQRLSVMIVAGDAVTRDVALEPALVYQDFAVAGGWTDDADPSVTGGFWEIAEPAGKWVNGVPLQPELDHTPGAEDQCAVTGNAAGAPGNGDVDGGAVRLLSPAFDLSGLSAPRVFYYRWFGSIGGTDPWETHVSTDEGDSWTLLESTTSNEAYWQPIDLDLAGITGPAPSVRFRFTCQDPAPDATIEGALDDFIVYEGAGPVGIVLPTKGPTSPLRQNFPNPFRSATQVSFELPREERVLLAVYDVNGRRVATLVDEVRGAGSHAVVWDGRLSGGARAAAGVYFYRMSTTTESAHRKMLLLR